MEEIQSQNSSRNIPLKEIVKVRTKKRTMEEAISYLDRKFSSTQPELDKRQGDDASSYGLTRGTSSDNIKARARPPGELSSGDQTTTSSYSGSSASLSVPLKVSDSGAVDVSNRSDEHTARNGYVPTAQLPYHKPLGGVDWERITDNVLYGVNPEESQPERASAYNWEVHDQTSLSSRYPCRCDDFRRSATTREKTGSRQHVTTPPISRPQYSTNTKGGQQHYADSSYYTFHQLGVPHCPRLTNVGVKDPEVTGNSQHVTTPLTGLPQYYANTKGCQQHDADSSYYTFHQLGVPHCPCLTNVGVKDPEVTGNSQHVTTPPTGRPQYSTNTKGGQQHDADSSYYTFHQLGVPHCPCLTNVGVKDPEVTGNSQHVTTPPTGRPQYSTNTKGGQQHDADSSYYTFHQLGVPHCPCLTNVGVKDPEVTGNSQHVTTPPTGRPQYSTNTKGGQRHDDDSSYYTFHKLGVPRCPCLTNEGVKAPEVTGISQHVTTPAVGRPHYSANTKGGQQHDADSSYYTFHQLGVPHCPCLTNVGVKDPEVTGNSQHVTTPPTGRPQYSANTKEGQQHDADSSYCTFHQLGVPRCPCLTNVGVKDPEVTGNSQHVTTPPTGRPQYSVNTKGGQQHDTDSSYYTFHQLGVPHCPCLTNVGVKDPEVTGNSQHVTTPPVGRPHFSANTKGGPQHDVDSSYCTFHQLGVPHCPRLTNVGVKDPEVTGNSQHVTTPPTGRPQHSANTKGGQQHDVDSSYYTFHQLGVPHCPCPTNVVVKDPEVTGNSQHVTTPPEGLPQYSVNTKGGQQHDADSSYCTFHQLGVPHVHCARLTNVEVKDPEVQPTLPNNGHSFNSSARAGACVHGINTKYANFGCNIGSDSQKIGCSGSYKSLSTKEGERRFEDRLPIIQETYISRSAKGLIGLEGETHVRSSNHLSSSDEPSNVSKAAKAPQQQKNMSSGHRRQEHIPSAEEAAKSRQAHRSQVNIESPVAPTGVNNVSSGATLQNRTNGDSTRKEDGTAYHSPPSQVQNLTQGSVKGPQTGAVSVAQTTLSREARAVKQAKKVKNSVCEHCLLPASYICRYCYQLLCGKCKGVYSVDICVVTKGEHEFVNLKASEGKGEQGNGISGGEWSCLRCTYVNPAENKICAICSTTRKKSKAIYSVDISAVTKGEHGFVNLKASEGKGEQGNGISGGEWSCLRCTYVNPAENKICAICSTTRKKCKAIYSVDISAVTKGEHEFVNLEASEGKGEQGIGISGDEWSGAVSVAQTTSSHEARVVKQTKRYGNNVCEHCSLPTSSICRFCYQLVCGKCKEVYSVDICAVTKGEHDFVNLTASERKGEQGNGISGGEWSCLRCTYVNPAENKICAICSTTRGLSAVELSKPGSRVCSTCTFHNKENATICSACFRHLDLNFFETKI